MGGFVLVSKGRPYRTDVVCCTKTWLWVFLGECCVAVRVARMHVRVTHAIGFLEAPASPQICGKRVCMCRHSGSIARMLWVFLRMLQLICELCMHYNRITAADCKLVTVCICRAAYSTAAASLLFHHGRLRRRQLAVLTRTPWTVLSLASASYGVRVYAGLARTMSYRVPCRAVQQMFFCTASCSWKGRLAYACRVQAACVTRTLVSVGLPS